MINSSYELEKKASLCKMGAYCAFITGISYTLIVCCAFLSPPSIASYVASPEYFTDFLSYQPIFITLKALMIIANSAFVGVIIAFHSLVRQKYYGSMTLFSTLAIIGSGVGILQSVMDMTMIPYLVNTYFNSSHDIQTVLIALGVANPAIYIISLGFPGLWFIAVSLMAYDNKKIPFLLKALGLLWGFGNILTIIAHLTVTLWLIYFVAFAALCAAPIWSIWEGLYLLDLSKKLFAKKN